MGKNQARCFMFFRQGRTKLLYTEIEGENKFQLKIDILSYDIAPGYFCSVSMSIGV